ncbi:MAG: hypothetical protein ABI263_06445 [Gelidibacter sp.]
MKKKKLIIVFILFGVVGFMVGKTVIGSFRTDTDNISKIQDILEGHCNCESIEKNMYAKGVQYGKDEGFTTEKVDFILTNCQYGNLNEEGLRIAKLLNVEGLETFNLITLEFVSEEKQETITIKNGKIQ